MQMQLAPILWVRSRALANPDSLAMEPTVRILMNAFLVHVIRMQHALTWRDHINAFATLDILAMGLIVKTSTNVWGHLAMRMLHVPTVTDPICVYATLAILGTELIVMVRIFIDEHSVI